MGRWWLIPLEVKKPFMKGFFYMPFSIRIHHIKKPDADPCLHDHPWAWRTIVLKGWYIEENAFGEFNTRRKGFTAGNSAETLHRIDEVSPGGVWTLFFMGRKYINKQEVNKWGFIVPLPDGRIRKVYYLDYVSTNNSGELVDINDYREKEAKR